MVEKRSRAWITNGEWQEVLTITMSKASIYDVTMHELCSTKKNRKIVLARESVILYLRDERRWSYPKIGAFLGKNHSTIILAERRARERQAASPPPHPLQNSQPAPTYFVADVPVVVDPVVPL
jgi:chromosomal replication initiation ATPase DnaA